MSAMARVVPTPIAEASHSCRATGRVTPRNGQLELDKLASRVSVPSLCLTALAGRMRSTLSVTRHNTHVTFI